MEYINKFVILLLLVLSIILFPVSDLQCKDELGSSDVPQMFINPTIVLVGTFYPADMRPKGEVISIKINESNFYFKIDKAKNLSGTELAYSIINNLLPPELKLTGPEELMGILMKKDIFGKQYSLKGTIYVSDNMMYLNMVMQGDYINEMFKDK